MRVRIHLQQVLLLRQIPFDASKDSYSQRRYWLRRLYEALFPPHPNMGNMASLEAAKIPELQEKIVDDIRSWILGFVFAPIVTIASVSYATIVRCYSSNHCSAITVYTAEFRNPFNLQQ
ncbi:hypothetical protein VNI00_009988 [Paramarasmius palmivorus]|uniref:Uncharacterized protein n=1 Tax=Paramarasmius palmivorus TaxID=297713 RepID=A0AAW0CQS1_9AGAR